MNKLTSRAAALLLTAILLLSCVSCAEAGGNVTDDETTIAADTTAEDTTAADDTDGETTVPEETTAEEVVYDPEGSKYNDAALWSFRETDKDAKIDTFFVAPTTATGDFMNMPLDNADINEKYTLQVGNQKGIYDDETRFFAPIYSQVTLQCYGLPEAERDAYLDIAYADVKEAFEYYLNCDNGGNGIILAGSSQGADMILRLVRDFFNDEESAKKLVCCYAIGWKVTDEYLSGLNFVHFAEGESDTASIVSFNSEAPEITSSLIVGAEEKTHGINPLSWKVTAEEASVDLNLGCCIYSTKGYQKGEDIVGFCGAYLDETRGTLKLTGMEAQDPDRTAYPSRIDGQDYGVYHIYDWEFFYRNLEANVQTRIGTYLGR